MKSQNKIEKIIKTKPTIPIKNLWPVGCEFCINQKLSKYEIKSLIDDGYYFNNNFCSSCLDETRIRQYI